MSEANKCPEGYPLTEVGGLQYTVSPEKQTLNFDTGFAKKYPPEIGDPVFYVRKHVLGDRTIFSEHKMKTAIFKRLLDSETQEWLVAEPDYLRIGEEQEETKPQWQDTLINDRVGYKITDKSGDVLGVVLQCIAIRGEWGFSTKNYPMGKYGFKTSEEARVACEEDLKLEFLQHPVLIEILADPQAGDFVTTKSLNMHIFARKGNELYVKVTDQGGEHMWNCTIAEFKAKLEEHKGKDGRSVRNQNTRLDGVDVEELISQWESQH